MRNFWKTSEDRSRCDWASRNSNDNTTTTTTAPQSPLTNESDEFVPPLITLPERVSTLHELAQREPCNMLIELDRRRQYLVTQSNAHRGYPHARDLTLIQDAWHRFVLNIYTLRVT